MARVRTKRRRVVQRRLSPTPPTVSLTVSLARGDDILGVRNGTVSKLVAAGRIRPVPWGRRRRVLVDDLRRVAAEGFTPRLQRPRGPRRQPTKAGIGAAILAIDLDALGVKP